MAVQKPFPLYDSLLTEAEEGEHRIDCKDICDTLELVYDELDSNWSRYLSTVIDLVIRRFYTLNSNRGPSYIEGGSVIAYEMDSLHPKLQTMIKILIDRCITSSPS